MSMRPSNTLDALRWFSRPDARRLMAGAQAQIEERLGRAFGCWGLHLMPGPGVDLPPMAHRVSRLLAMHRCEWRLDQQAASGSERGLTGAVRCRDDQLPFADAGMALVVAQHVLETSEHPRALIASLARLIEPEGTLVLLILNPWSPLRWRWRGRRIRPPSQAQVRVWLAENDLTIESEDWVGGYGRAGRTISARPLGPVRPWHCLRFARLIVARRHQPGLTPLPAGRPGLRLGAGVGAR